jgi:hypothetical protein
MYLLRNDKALNEIIELNDISTTEQATRTEEDVDVLDTVIETQQLLQKTVLMHFGTTTDENEEMPVMNKLNERMAKIAANKEERDGDAKSRDSDMDEREEMKG